MRFALVLLAVGCAAACAAHAENPVRVGSKRFTESYILGEIVARAAVGEHSPGLGNTGIVLAALKAGAIDVYPEYTGTIAREILKVEENLDLEQLNRRLEPLGLAVSVPLGYSLVVRRAAVRLEQIYAAYADFLPVRAGLVDQLALQLGFAPDLIGTSGSGATPVRLTLYRRSVKDPGYLAKKKVVVWCFAAREFTEATEGWAKVPIAK